MVVTNSTKGVLKMKCYYCHEKCEGFVFEQGNFSVIAHKECAIEKVNNDGKLLKG